MTTILALLPMALGFGEGAEIRAPMAITVIGGLLVSSLLTLLVIPVVYIRWSIPSSRGIRENRPIFDSEADWVSHAYDEHAGPRDGVAFTTAVDPVPIHFL